MTVTLFITCVVWFIGFMLSVQALSNDPHHITSRTAILVACAFWPLAIAVAVVRIIVGTIKQ